MTENYIQYASGYQKDNIDETELNKILESYPTTVNHTDIIDFDNFDERLSFSGKFAVKIKAETKNCVKICFA